MMCSGCVGYGIYIIYDGDSQSYRFIDGRGSTLYMCSNPKDLGAGPGAGATDERVPELGSDLSVLRTSRITMADALTTTKQHYNPTIKTKFKLNDNGKLSLSIYPVGKGLGVD